MRVLDIPAGKPTHQAAEDGVAGAPVGRHGVIDPREAVPVYDIGAVFQDGADQLGNVGRLMLAVAVQLQGYREALRSRIVQAGSDRRADTQVPRMPQHVIGARLARGGAGAVRRAVVDDAHLKAKAHLREGRGAPAGCRHYITDRRCLVQRRYQHHHRGRGCGPIFHR